VQIRRYWLSRRGRFPLHQWPTERYDHPRWRECGASISQEEGWYEIVWHFIQDPVSVENAIHRDERVMEAAAVGVPDERLGELVTALVTIKPAYKGQVKEAGLIALAEKQCVLSCCSEWINDWQTVLYSLPKFAVPVMIMVYEGEFGTSFIFGSDVCAHLCFS